MNAILFIALLTFLGSSLATGSDVIVLNNDNFDAEIAKHPLILVEFYAPWCGHCKHLAPEYEIAATQLKEFNLPIAKVDADEEVNRPLASRFGVRGFPTLKLFRNGVPSDFTGQRTGDGIFSWMKKQSLPAISTLNNVEEATKFAESENVVIVGFFDSRDSTEYTTFKTTAEQLRDSFLFGEVIGQSDSNKHFGVDGSVGAVLFKKFDEGKNILSQADFSTLPQFIAANSVPLIDEIGPHNFKTYVDGGIPLGYLFVDLTVEGQRDEYIAKIKDLAQTTKGKLNWVYIDWAKYAKHSERLGLSGTKVPAVAIEKLDAGAHYAYDESAEISTANIEAWVNKFLAGELKPTIKSEPVPESNNEPVTILVADNFNEIVNDNTKDVLVEFYAPWCGHCKQIAPIYEELGKAFDDVPNVIIAKIDATANDVDPSLGIKGFPTIKFFPANNKKEPIEYSGDRTVDDFVTFIKQHGGGVEHNVEAGKGSKDEL